MKTKKTIVLLLLVFGITTLHAQQITTAISSSYFSGDNISYTVGQVVYTTYNGTNGSVAQGIQQAYEVYSLRMDETELNISLQSYLAPTTEQLKVRNETAFKSSPQAYPNPTTDYLQLKVEIEQLQDFNYQLFDITGKLLISKKITNTTEIIPMENLPSANYFLIVSNNNTEVKSLKTNHHEQDIFYPGSAVINDKHLCPGSTKNELSSHHS